MRNRLVRGPVLAGMAMALCCAGVTGAADPGVFGEPASPPPAGPAPVGGWPPPWTEAPGDQADPWPEAEAEVLRLANKERSKAGCPALGTDEVLAGAAREHSQAMAREGLTETAFHHGRSASDRARDRGYARPAGEVVASGFDTPEEAVRAWTRRDGQAGVLTNCSAEEGGAGVVREDDGTYWTLILGYGS